MPASGDGIRLFLFYDAQCPLCVHLKELVSRWDRDGAILALGLDNAELPARFPDLDLSRARQQLTVRDPQGRLFEGGAAVQQLARLLPGVRRLTWVYRLPGVAPAVEGLYRTVHRYRTRLCLQCGERWMPSRKYSQRKRGRRR
jgi:predicted DCC family thiol-disulfide oxidoreductase YuxK